MAAECGGKCEAEEAGGVAAAALSLWLLYIEWTCH